MDAGARVAWAARHNFDELSAIQHAMNLKLDRGDAAFFAEFQNEPLPEHGPVEELLSADQIVATAGGYRRGLAPILLPSHGKYIGASGKDFREWTVKPGDQMGQHWFIPTLAGKRVVRHVLIDTNFWKSFVFDRLAAAMGDKGTMTLFGRRPEEHRLLADHLTAEYRVRTQGRGRTVDEWRARPGHFDNHWLDCLVGCAVAASIAGARLAGADFVPRRPPLPVHPAGLSRRAGPAATGGVDQGPGAGGAAVAVRRVVLRLRVGGQQELRLRLPPVQPAPPRPGHPASRGGRGGLSAACLGPYRGMAVPGRDMWHSRPRLCADVAPIPPPGRCPRACARASA
jgi:hypothetical protein